MSYHAYKAQEIFDDAKQYINLKQDPVTWDLVNGLSELAQSVRSLHSEVDNLKQQIQSLRR